MKLHENIQHFIDTYGEPDSSIPLSSEQKKYLSQIMPTALYEFFSKYGFVSYSQGIFRTCDPKDYYPTLNNIFCADPDFGNNSIHVLGHSPFGDLYCWSNEMRSIEIQLYYGWVHCYRLTASSSSKISIDRASSSFLPKIDEIDFYDFYNEPLFDSCIKKLGAAK